MTSHTEYIAAKESWLCCQWKDTDHYEVVARISTGKLARTSLFDPASGRLYVPVPRQLHTNSPELRVFQAKPE